jgi:hypothetical protein
LTQAKTYLPLWTAGLALVAPLEALAMVAPTAMPATVKDLSRLQPVKIDAADGRP